MAVRAAFELLEREDDTAAIGRTLEDALAGNGRVVALSGSAGIGKTRLLRDLRARADDAGATTLSAIGSEVERELAFGVVRQLFEAAVDKAGPTERDTMLSGAAALAAPALRLPASAPPSMDPAFAQRHGLYWLAVNLASASPLLITIDDAHWADSDSLRWMDYLARRIEGLPLLLALAVRPDEVGEEDFSLIDDPRTTVIRPRTLSAEAVGSLAGSMFGAEPTEKFVTACHLATGGNPFLVGELLGALAEASTQPDDAAASRVAGIAPGAVSRNVLARVGRLGPRAGRVAEAVAVLGDRAQVSDVAAVARLTVEDAAAGADALIGAQILDSRQPLAFVHPILRAAVYADISIERRTAGHAEAAAALTRRGAEPALVAAQLLLSEPRGDKGAVEVLHKAAQEATAAGSPGSAVTYLKRALSEPPPDSSRVQVLVDLGRAQAQAGDPAAASVSIRAALELVPDPIVRALVARGLAGLYVMGGRAVDAIEVLDRALADLEDGDADIGLPLEIDIARAGQFTLEARMLTSARTPRFDPHDGAPTGLTQAYLAMETVMKGAAGGAATFARGALEEGRLLAGEGAESQTFYMAANALALSSETEAALATYTDALDDARARGSVRGFSIASCYRSLALFAEGRLAAAESDARAALELDPDGLGVIAPIAVAALVSALVERGELDEASAAIGSHLFSQSEREPLFFSHYLMAAARLALARRDPGRATEHLLECGRREGAWGVDTPALTQWRAMLAPVLAAAGEGDRARELASVELERSRAFGSARHLGVALSAMGSLEEGTKRVECFEEAVATLAPTPARLEHARALVGLGGILRRQRRRRDAREPLREALALAREAGATPLAKHAHAELEATGARPRKIVRSGIEELTSSERRVAELATAGMTNREIAQALFVTVKTVETHLHRAFQKLEIGSRRDLAGALTAQGE